MRVKLAGTVVAALVAGVFLARPGFLEKIDDAVCDVLTSLVSRGSPSGQVVIVEVDDAAIAQFGRWPWPRDLLARVVRRILDRGAATVALDMSLNTAPESAVNDEVLADALRGHPVVVGYIFRFDDTRSTPSNCVPRPLPLAVVGPAGSRETGFLHPSGVLCNARKISDAATGDGFLNASVDSDGKLRHVPLVMEYGDRQYPSLALAAVDAYRHTSAMQLDLDAREASSLRLGAEGVPLEGPAEIRLRYRGKRRTLPYVSVSSVLDDHQPLENLRGKLVIVGGSALGLPNPVVTPLDAQFPDAEIQATAMDNLLVGDSFRRPAGWHLLELFLALVAGVGATFLLVLDRTTWRSALIVFGTAAAMWVVCVLLLSKTGLILSPLPLTAVLACNFPAVTLLNYLQEKRRAESTERLLSLEREKGLAVLRESESRYEQLVENINDAITVDDAGMRLVFANRRFREWFELVGKDIREIGTDDFVAPEWRIFLKDRHRRLMIGEKVPESCEYEGQRTDGTRIWIEALVTAVIQDGQIVGTQSAMRDITERKLMEAQYLQAQKMESVGRLAGGVAHDFNNLLQVINGYTELLLNGEPDENEYLDGLKEIRAAGERAAELTRNLLTFSRKQVVRPTLLNLNLVVAEAEKMFGQLIGEDIELTTALSPALQMVMADSGQIHQILMNLLVNARDAMPHGGRILIETRDLKADESFVRRHPQVGLGSPWVYIGVTDSGSGMSEHVKRHLFEPFFTTKEPGRGTGLGLSTIYGIVEQSSGLIEVTSQPGKGTTFHIYLPQASGEQQGNLPASEPARMVQGSGTVLVVEDQEAVRGYLRAVLESTGYRVLDAGSGTDALELAEHFEGTIDLLISDLVMPQMNGRDLAERLKLTRPNTKVLFMSGYEKESMDTRGIGPGDLFFLQKPFTPEQMRASVLDALGNREEPRVRASGSGA